MQSTHQWPQGHPSGVHNIHHEGGQDKDDGRTAFDLVTADLLQRLRINNHTRATAMESTQDEKYSGWKVFSRPLIKSVDR